MGCGLTKSVQNSLLHILLVHFGRHFNIQTLFLAFFVNRMDQTKKSSKMLANFLVDFLPILYQKLKNYFALSIRHPLAKIDFIQVNSPALNSQCENLFWTLFYNPDHCWVCIVQSMMLFLLHDICLKRDKKQEVQLCN